MLFSNALVESVARTLWVNAWASWTDELPRAEQRKLGITGGADLMDLAPDEPPAARVFAKNLLTQIERTNKVSLEEVIEDLGADEEDFGHYLAMEALGTGVAWTDDNDPHGLEIPLVEVYSYDGETLEGSGFYLSDPRHNPPQAAMWRGTPLPEGIEVLRSMVNQAYFIMGGQAVLSVQNDRESVDWYLLDKFSWRPQPTGWRRQVREARR